MRIRYFGIISSLALCTVLTVVLLFGVNLINNEEVGKIPIYFWLILFLSFVSLVFFGKKIGIKALNGTYFIFAYLSFLYFFSMLFWTVACCPEEYDSYIDWNAAKGITWIIHLPIVSFGVIAQGIFYDILRTKFIH